MEWIYRSFVAMCITAVLFGIGFLAREEQINREQTKREMAAKNFCEDSWGKWVPCETPAAARRLPSER